jgi:hypothetical protein
VPEVQWHCRRRDELTFRNWSDGSVLFDDANGQLQCLTPVSATLMAQMFLKRSWGASELAKEILGEVPNADDVKMVENVLVEFSSLNLIERVSV